ncbi:hypothetical protein [Sandaracinus amylolyticus]|uniref:Peptidase M15B domain-containing protein n=1 Tax=Sandaracinus amylolyticus TaxID=927083 RepID=A0A0F6SG95_9BACT|nr:hypothetical protein [Sandaracinus amylolyticus]AKF08304.1 hypothetical protein DB32_005453 [Sandaracinus amylolyticus]
MRGRTCLLALALVGGGCAAETADATEASDDHGHDAVFSLLDAAEIESELDGATVHDAETEFVRLSYLYRSPAPMQIEIATSLDGTTWSEWREGVISEEASDEEYGVWVADLDVIDDASARYWRVRGVDVESLPTELAVDTLDAEELASDLESELDVDPDGTEMLEDATVGVATESLVNFRRYRFDLGRVGRSWLWLLRTARRRGWSGSLYGSRTGLRTYAQQASLWNLYQSGRGAPAFPPWGPSRHLVRNVRRVGTWYQAVDTNDVPRLIRIARGLGVSLHRPYSREPWHVEARRSFGPPRGWRP